jgi:hypothetical protein
MKKVLAVVLLTAFAATSVPAVAASVCLDTVRIKSTSVPDAHHIIFHMIDGTQWSNALKNACPGLRFNGFVYEPFADRQVCENLQTIRVLQDHSICMLGAFTKLPPKKV